MKDYKLDILKNVEGKSSKNKKSKRKSFGYQVLGFGSGEGAGPPFNCNFLVIAGGGGGNLFDSGGGGSGGYRNSFDGPSPLKSSALSDLAAGTYSVTVGAGGTPGNWDGSCITSNAAPGGDSIFNPGGSEGTDMITSTGGGAGGAPQPHGTPTPQIGAPGGSGGGGSAGLASGGPAGPVPIPQAAGIGNTPPFSPPQGNPAGPIISRSGGGGGAGGVGPPGGQPHGQGSPGAPGLASSITGSPVTRGGGGGGGIGASAESLGTGGPGGGGNGGRADVVAQAGTANTGGGGGGGGGAPAPTRVGGAGGSGIVVLRIPGANTVSVTPCTNTVATCVGSCNETVATFTVSGTVKVS